MWPGRLSQGDGPTLRPRRGGLRTVSPTPTRHGAAICYVMVTAAKDNSTLRRSPGRYDGLGRRRGSTTTCRSVADGHRIVEIRAGADDETRTIMQQLVWGLDYVDELVQPARPRRGIRMAGGSAINQDYSRGGETDPGECERLYWACQDGNFNVIGLVATEGSLTERYEYTTHADHNQIMKRAVSDTYDATLEGLDIGATGVTQGLHDVFSLGGQLCEVELHVDPRFQDYFDQSRFCGRVAGVSFALAAAEGTGALGAGAKALGAGGKAVGTVAIAGGKVVADAGSALICLGLYGVVTYGPDAAYHTGVFGLGFVQGVTPGPPPLEGVDRYHQAGILAGEAVGSFPEAASGAMSTVMDTISR